MYSLLQRHPKVARVLELVGWSVVINILALLACLTVIGIPPAIGASFAFFSRLARSEHADLLDHFAKNLRTLFWRSWAAFLIIAAPVGFAVVNVQLVMAGHVPYGGIVVALSLIIGILALLGGLYLWPLLALVDRPLPQLARLAMQLVLGHLPWSLATLAVTSVLVSLCLAAPAFGGVLGFGFTVMAISLATWRVIGHYAPPVTKAQA